MAGPRLMHSGCERWVSDRDSATTPALRTHTSLPHLHPCALAAAIIGRPLHIMHERGGGAAAASGPQLETTTVGAWLLTAGRQASTVDAMVVATGSAAAVEVMRLPDTRLVAAYDAAYRRHTAVYEAMRSVYTTMAARVERRG